MPTPKEWIGRAKANKACVLPPRPETKQRAQQETVTLQPKGQKSVYRQLMQRHDRVHPRHIQG